MNTPTPETDAYYAAKTKTAWPHQGDIEFARKIERERDESRSWVKAAMGSAAIAPVTIAGLERERDQLRR